MTERSIATPAARALDGVIVMVARLANGNILGVAEAALEMAVDLLPVEDLRGYLTKRGVTLANAAADAVEDERFPKP